MYADYGYYLAGFLHKEAGLISENEFPRYAEQASGEMDYRTAGRITGALVERTEVKSCCCAIAETLYRYDKARGNDSAAPVASWSNDGESGSYDMGNSNVTDDGLNRRITRMTRSYLWRLGVLYRGC